MKTLSVLLLAAVAVPTFAQMSREADALRMLFVEGPQSVEYTDQLAQALSPAQLGNVLDNLQRQLGEFRSVSGNQNPYTTVFQQGTATTYVALDDEGRLAGLRFTELIPAVASLDEALERLRSLPGTTSFLITRDGVVVAAENEDAPLAVGSAFKLAVLAAVKDAVESGDLAWDQTVEMRDEWKSLPTGVLQDWAAGISLTIESLATLMISLSDNTATDALIDIVRRREVEAYAPNSRPLLTTAEAFRLKNPVNSSLLQEYRQANEAGKRRVLRRVSEAPLPGADLFAAGPVAQDIEWFFSVRELCTLMGEVSDLDLMTVNPGVASTDRWSRVAYKGGSEPGVLNMTTQLTAEDGTVYCVSVTTVRDDAVIDETAVFTAYQGVLGTLE